MDSNVTPFVKVPKAILFDPDLNVTQKLLYIVLLSFTNSKNDQPVAWPSQKTLGLLTKRTRGSLWANSQALVEKKLIEICESKIDTRTGLKKRNPSNLYKMLPLATAYPDKLIWNNKEWCKFLNIVQKSERGSVQKNEHKGVQKNGHEYELRFEEELITEQQDNDRLVDEGLFLEILDFFKNELKNNGFYSEKKNSKKEVEIIKAYSELRGENTKEDLMFFAKNWKFYESSYEGISKYPLSVKTLGSPWIYTILSNLEKDKKKANRRDRWA